MILLPDGKYQFFECIECILARTIGVITNRDFLLVYWPSSRNAISALGYSTYCDVSLFDVSLKLSLLVLTVVTGAPIDSDFNPLVHLYAQQGEQACYTIDG